MSLYYEDEHVTLYHGEYEDVLPTLDAVDHVIAKVGVDVGVIIHLDDGRTAYATLGAFHGTHTRELEPGTRIITRDEFDDITGISTIRREMGWVD